MAKNLPIPEVTPENMVFFQKHMKLSDAKTAVRLEAETYLAKIVWDQMMNIYRTNVNLMGKDHPDLNKAVQEERIAWLTAKGVSRKGLIIFLGDKPCWRIDETKIGPRRAYYDDMVEEVKKAQTVQKLSSIKRSMKVLQDRFVVGQPKDSTFRGFHLGQLNRINTAIDVRKSAL